MEPWLTTGTSHPGRMAPNTALVLSLLGAAFVVAGMRQRRPWQTLAAGTLAAITAGLALIALVGYTAGIESAYSWAYWTDMAVPTAVALFLLGTALFALMLLEGLRAGGALALRMEIPVGIFLLVLVILLAQSLRVLERQDIHEIIETEAESLRREATAHVQNIAVALVRMAERWEYDGGTPRDKWKIDAQNYLDDHPSLNALAWTDADSIVRWVAPLAGNEAALGHKLSEEPRRARAAARARVRDRVAISRTIDLVTGGKGFLVLAPLFYQGEFRGYITGAFRFDRLFDRLYRDSAFAQAYGFTIEDGTEQVFIHGAEYRSITREWQVTETLTFGETTWRMAAWPSPQQLAFLQSPLPEITLAGGIALVVLSVLSLHGFNIASRRTVQAERANAELAREIEQRRQAEGDLAAARARLNNILEAAGEGIFGLDTEGRTTFANPAACRMTGWPAEEMIGRGQHDLIHHTRPDGTPYPREECPIYAAFVDGETHDVDDELFWRRDGEPFPVEYNSTPLRDEEGTLNGAVIVFRDVSERRQKEEALRQRTAELAAANQELESFAYSVSHDLRAPLRSMDGFSQALFEDFGDRLDGDARDYLARIRAASRRMEQLIDGILTISRVSRADLQYMPVDLSKLAAEVVEEYRNTEPQREVNVVIEPGLSVEGDPRLLHAMLQNLVGNAWKFTVGIETPRIEIGQEFIDGLTAFYVRDNGAGFDPQYVGKLFRPFQRLHSDSEFAGTGIGLATVARIMHRHGGSVWADGRPGAGATIHFSFEPIGDHP